MREVCGARRVVSGDAVNRAVIDVPAYELRRLMRELGPVADDELLVITVQRLSACDVDGCLQHAH